MKPKCLPSSRAAGDVDTGGVGLSVGDGDGDGGDVPFAEAIAVDCGGDDGALEEASVAEFDVHAPRSSAVSARVEIETEPSA